MASSPTTNLSTGVSTKPTRLVPDYLSKTQNYLPLSVFFTGIPEEEAEPNSLFGFKMPDRTRKPTAPKTPKKNKGGDTSSEKDAKGKDDEKDEKAKGKGPQKGPQGPERSQTSKPRPAASVPSQGAQGGGEAPSGAKQESKGAMWKPQKCKLCNSQADKRIIWADGRAYMPVCADHVEKGKAHLKKKNGKWAEIVAVKTVKNMNEALSALLFGAQNWQSTASSVEESAANAKSIALMKWLSKAAQELRAGRHVYVVGGAVRNFVIDKPIKDVDVVIDAVSLGRGRDSEWFAKQLQRKMGAKSSLATNQYGVAILTVKSDWDVDGHNLKGEVIEIANARSESYGGAGGKGYKPSEVKPASIERDIKRREFTFNTLMWRLADLAKGPDKAEIVDLTGCGLADLKANTMRCPVNPDKTFSDDPTRMLRAIKFMIKYGFKISGETEQSIRRNAAKIRNAPSSAIAKLLIDPILKDPKTAPKALREMKRLGLLDVVADMARTDKQFASTLENWADDQRVSMLFNLMDLGLPLRTKLGAFTPDQQKRIRKVTATMPDDKAVEFLAGLKQPGKVWKDKLFFPTLATDSRLRPMFVGKLAMRDLSLKVNAVAQEALLSNPELLDSPAQFKAAIRRGLSLGEGMTTTANVPTLPVPIGAGDGRKFLDSPDDDKKKRKRKRKRLSRSLYVLLRQ